MPSETESFWDLFKQAGKQISHYLIWFLFFGLGLGFVLLVHENLEVLLFLRVNPWHLRAYRLWSIVVLGIAFIVCIFLIEGYLRRSRSNGRLVSAFLKVLSVELALIAVSAAALYMKDLRDFLLFF